MWSRNSLNLFLFFISAFVCVIWMSPLPPMELSSGHNFSSNSFSNGTLMNGSSIDSGKLVPLKRFRFFLVPFNTSSLRKLKRVEVPSLESNETCSLFTSVNRTEMWLKWMGAFEKDVQSHDSYHDLLIIPTDVSAIEDSLEEWAPNSNGSKSRSFESVLSASGRVVRWFENKFPEVDVDGSLENVRDHIINQSKEMELDVEQFLDHVFDVLERPESNRSRSRFDATALLLARHFNFTGNQMSTEDADDHQQDGTATEVWMEDSDDGSRQLDFSTDLAAESLLRMFEEWLNTTYVQKCSEDSTKRECDLLLKALEDCLKSLDSLELKESNTSASKRSMDYGYVPVESARPVERTTPYYSVSTYSPSYSSTVKSGRSMQIENGTAVDLGLVDSEDAASGEPADGDIVEEKARDFGSGHNQEEELGSGHRDKDMRAFVSDHLEDIDSVLLGRETGENSSNNEQVQTSSDFLMSNDTTSGNVNAALVGVDNEGFLSTEMSQSEALMTTTPASVPAAPVYVQYGYGRQFEPETANGTVNFTNVDGGDNGTIKEETTVEWKTQEEQEIDTELKKDEHEMELISGLMSFMDKKEKSNGTEFFYDIVDYGSGSILNDSALGFVPLPVLLNDSRGRNMGWSFEDERENDGLNEGTRDGFGQVKDLPSDGTLQPSSNGGSFDEFNDRGGLSEDTFRISPNNTNGDIKMDDFSQQKDSIAGDYSRVSNGGSSDRFGDREGSDDTTGSFSRGSNTGIGMDNFNQQKELRSDSNEGSSFGTRRDDFGHEDLESGDESVRGGSHQNQDTENLDHQFGESNDRQGGAGEYLSEDRSPNGDRNEFGQGVSDVGGDDFNGQQLPLGETKESQHGSFHEEYTETDSGNRNDEEAARNMKEFDVRDKIAANKTSLWGRSASLLVNVTSDLEESRHVNSSGNESVPEDYDYYFENWHTDDNSSAVQDRIMSQSLLVTPMSTSVPFEGSSFTSRLFQKGRDFEENTTSAIVNSTTIKSTTTETSVPTPKTSSGLNVTSEVANPTENPQDVIPELGDIMDVNSTTSESEIESLNVSRRGETSTPSTEANFEDSSEISGAADKNFTVSSSETESSLLTASDREGTSEKLSTEHSTITTETFRNGTGSTHYMGPTGIREDVSEPSDIANNNSTTAAPVDDNSLANVSNVTYNSTPKSLELSTNGVSTTSVSNFTVSSVTASENVTTSSVGIKGDGFPPFIDDPYFTDDQKEMFVPLTEFGQNDTWLSQKYLPLVPNKQKQESGQHHEEYHSYYHKEQSGAKPRPPPQHSYGQKQRPTLVDQLNEDIESPVEVYNEPLPFRPLKMPTMDVLCHKNSDCSKEMGEICIINGFFSFCDCPLYYQRHPATGVCVERVEPDPGFLIRARREVIKGEESYPEVKLEVHCSEEFCSNHGSCYVTMNNSTFCSCYTWYFGRKCHIDAMVVVLGILAGMSALSILALVFTSLYCWRRRSHEGYFGSSLVTTNEKS